MFFLTALLTRSLQVRRLTFTPDHVRRTGLFSFRLISTVRQTQNKIRFFAPEINWQYCRGFSIRNRNLTLVVFVDAGEAEGVVCVCVCVCVYKAAGLVTRPLKLCT